LRVVLIIKIKVRKISNTQNIRKNKMNDIVKEAEAIAPPTFIEFLKKCYLHIEDKYYGRFDSQFDVKKCGFSEIKYATNFVGKDFDDFLLYYEENIAGKSCFFTSILYFDIFYNDNGFGRRVRLNSLTVNKYFNDIIGFIN